jgi:hypothetical protein
MFGNKIELRGLHSRKVVVCDSPLFIGIHGETKVVENITLSHF